MKAKLIGIMAGTAFLIAAIGLAFLGVQRETAGPQEEASAPGTVEAPSFALQEKLASTEPSSTSDGKEKGNLSERGVKELLSDGEFEAALAASAKGPVFVFKHSTDCPISGGAYRRVGEWLQEKGAAAPPFYLVKVIERKPVSQNIAAQIGVKHESPQLILLEGEKAVWDTSHEAIDAEAIESALKTKETPESS